MNTLKVGDKIYVIVRNSNYIQRVLKVERITKTQAIAGGEKFKIEYPTKYIRRISSNKWDMLSYEIESDVLISRLERQKLLYNISQIDFSNLSTDILKEIIQLSK